MEERHMLVQRGQLDQVITDLIEKQKAVVEEIGKVLPLVSVDEALKKSLERKRKLAEAQLKVLEKGYIPIEEGFFWDINTKSRWQKNAVKEIIATMPEEVVDVMNKAIESGDFEKIKVNGSRRGDPLLVGSSGGSNYLLAMWVNLAGGYSVGFTFTQLRKVKGV